MTALEPDRDQLAAFVKALFCHAGKQGFVSLRAYHEHDQSTFRITPTRLSGGLGFLVEAAVDDARRAAQNPKAVVFCPPVAVFSNSDHAGKADVLAGPALTVDCDKFPSAARTKLQEILGPATVVVHSGGEWTDPTTGEIEPKCHLHWRLARPATGPQLAVLEKARKIANAIVGGDATNSPISHPIRWPGSWHRKADPRLCSIVEHNPNVEINLDNALAALIAEAPEEAHVSDSEFTSYKGRPWADSFRGVVTGENFHQSLVSLSAKFITAGINDGTTVNVLRGLMEASTAARDLRWAARSASIPTIVTTAREKYARAIGDAVLDPWQPYIVPQFPSDILPASVQGLVNAQARAIGCDPSAVAMAALANISGALDHRFRLKMMRGGNWYASPRLWVMLVGAVSARKTPAMREATRFLETRQNDLWDRWERERDEAKALDPKAPDPPKPVRHVVGSATIEAVGQILSRQDRGILVKNDELAGWIGAMEKYGGSSKGASADRGFWLQSYDGGPFTVDRITRGEQRIRNLSCSVLGGIQPERLAEIRGLSTDGLLQRFIPTMMGPANFAVDADTEADAANYESLTNALLDAMPKRILLNEGAFTLILSDEADRAAHETRRRIFDLEQAAAGLDTGFQGFVGKLAGTFGTLILLLHLAHDPAHGITTPVHTETVARAARLVEDFILPHAHAFYSTSTANGNLDRIQRAASYILTEGTPRVLVSDLTRMVAAFRGMEMLEVNKAVSPLVAGGWLLPEGDGPVTRAWQVNPKVFEQLAERKAVEERRKVELARLMNSPRAKRGKVEDAA